ncbi:IclR family transcriptional regulator [Planctomicrobium sp. SH661]|uniref:IclR family transcriptional regulator n=1 Tax=Planctomicrobium sp. SH661 TaxID=3448124 RepID=UPI003F5B08F9
MTTNKSNDRYAAPALDKGLDILELLAGRPEGLSLKQIADALGRNSTEIFRMLNQLRERAYIHRFEPGGVYRLSLKLFELAHRFPPTARLLEVAVPAIRQLADRTGQSCHLSVLHGSGILVLAQTTSSANWHFSVRLGATFSVTETASGRVLLAFSNPDVREEILARAGENQAPALVTDEFHRELEKIRSRGYEQVVHETFRGVNDISAPIFGHGQHGEEILAALTIPVLLVQKEKAPLTFIREQLLETAGHISSQLGAPQMDQNDTEGI